VLSTPLPEAFLRLAFGAVPFETAPAAGCGVLQADALGSDPGHPCGPRAPGAATAGAAGRRGAWLLEQRQPLLVLADVPPAAAALAQAVGAALVFMGNFGWDAIYGPMGPTVRALGRRCSVPATARARP
jgi:hypothetical protein